MKICFSLKDIYLNSVKKYMFSSHIRIQRPQIKKEILLFQEIAMSLSTEAIALETLKKLDFFTVIWI